MAGDEVKKGSRIRCGWAWHIERRITPYQYQVEDTRVVKSATRNDGKLELDSLRVALLHNRGSGSVVGNFMKNDLDRLLRSPRRGITACWAEPS